MNYLAIGLPTPTVCNLELWISANNFFMIRKTLWMAGIPLFQAYFKYEDKLSELVDALQPLLDSPPPNIDRFLSGSLRQKWGEWTQSVKPLVKVGEINHMCFSQDARYGDHIKVKRIRSSHGVIYKFSV